MKERKEEEKRESKQIDNDMTLKNSMKSKVYPLTTGICDKF